MEDEFSKVNCKLLRDLETYIYIHIKYIPVEFGLFLNATETLSFQVIGIVERKGFQTLCKIKNKKDSIEMTPKEHSQQNPFHNHQLISPASETARFGGLAVPFYAAHRGASAILAATDHFPLIGFAPIPLRRHPKCIRPALYRGSLGGAAGCLSSSLDCGTFYNSRRCSSNRWRLTQR